MIDVKVAGQYASQSEMTTAHVGISYSVGLLVSRSPDVRLATVHIARRGQRRTDMSPVLHLVPAYMPSG